MSTSRKSHWQHNETEEVIREFREKFLDAIQEIAPEVKESMQKLVPIYQELIGNAPSGGELAGWLNGCNKLEDSDPSYEEIRDMLTLRFLQIRLQQRYVDPARMAETRDWLWTTFLALRNGFMEFLSTFGLTTEWLREEYWTYLVRIARGEKPARTIAYTIGIPEHPLPRGPMITLKIDGWEIDETWPDFEQRCRHTLEMEMSSHRTTTMRYFAGLGHRLKTKPLDYASVKCLVLWTVKRMSKAEILELIDKENEASGKTYDLKSLEKAFRALKKYDLPVRKGNKSMPLKST